MTKVTKLRIELFGPEASEAIIQPIYFDSEGLQDDFYLMPAVKGEAQMLQISRPNSVLQEGNGCSLEEVELMNISNRFIKVKRVGMKAGICKDSLENTTLARQLKAGVDCTRIDGTFLETATMEIAQDAIKKDLQTIAWFGDSSSAQLPYRLADGIWSKIFNMAHQNAIPRVNTGSGTPLGAGGGLQLMKEVYESQSNAMYGKDNSDKVFYVTREVHERYISDLEAGQLNGAGYIQAVTEKQAFAYMYRGVPIKVMPSWSEEALAVFGISNANYILLTVKDNLTFATDVNADAALQSLEIWYSQDDNRYKVRNWSMIGFDFALPTMMVAGY